jgi:hypothetical protein
MFLEQLQYEVTHYFDLTMRLESYVEADRESIALVSQDMLPWYSFDRGQTITHPRQNILTSGVKSTNNTAIEQNRSDLRRCRVSKQRHHLATPWCRFFGQNCRHVAASVASLISLVSIVPNLSPGSRVRVCLGNHHLYKYRRLHNLLVLCERIDGGRGKADGASELLCARAQTRLHTLVTMISDPGLFKEKIRCRWFDVGMSVSSGSRADPKESSTIISCTQK